MSVALNTPINALCFLSELDRIELSTSGDQSVEVAISKGSEIFRNTYIPDDIGQIVIYDLDKVLEPYLDLGNLNTNQFNLTIGSNTTQFIVIPCSAAVNEAAATFVPDFFLSPMMMQRDTCIGRFETVTPFVASDTPYTVMASYYDGGSTLHTRQFSARTTAACGPIDVSPARFVDETLGELVSYIVQCGNRKARYRVLRSMPEADPAIIFRNCFGCWETIYLTGTKTQQPKFTRSSAIIDGCFKVYDISEEMLWEAHTGSLRPGMVAVANDLARSKSVFLLDSKGNAGEEIVITDCDTKTDNDDDEIPDMKFTFRRANNRSALIQAIRPPRIFDHHFDEKFE